MERKSRFPDWKTIYETEPVETMAWFCSELDPDLKKSLDQKSLREGRFLDIGSGPGTQALALSQIGFVVTGTDLSEGAVRAGQKLSPRIQFIQDDIVHSKLQGQWDFAFDRGCFHCLDPKDRAVYVETVGRLLVPGGLLFLKTFSWKQEDWGYGPWRFSPKEIEMLFSSGFNCLSSVETEYQGTLPQNPKALFSVLEKK
ncbi:class I SAM-dependent methyltransferase [bacterium]|nr:class I SAM-dependent methyltransferase [bacterium]